MEAIRQRFCNTLSFVVACTRANRVDVTPANSRHWHSASTVDMESNVLVFRLWVDLRVTVNLRSAGDEEARLCALCETQHIQSTHERCFDGLHGIILIMRRRRRAGEVVDFWQ